MIQDSLPEQELAEEELAEVVAQSVVKNMDLYALIRAITFRGFSDVLKKSWLTFAWSYMTVFWTTGLNALHHELIVDRFSLDLFGFR